MKLLRSNQLLGVNQGLRVTPKRWKTTFFFMFLCEPYVSLSCVQWKKYLFGNFLAFFIVFYHVNACASMRSLVEIHNRQMNWEYTYQSTSNHFILFYLDFTRARRRNNSQSVIILCPSLQRPFRLKTRSFFINLNFLAAGINLQQIGFGLAGCLDVVCSAVLQKYWVDCFEDLIAWLLEK